jgi:hypothetical protein
MTKVTANNELTDGVDPARFCGKKLSVTIER